MRTAPLAIRRFLATDLMRHPRPGVSCPSAADVNPDNPQTPMNLLKLVAIGMAGCALTTSALAATHPGMLHTEADFLRMKTQVNANVSGSPWVSGWNRLIANSHAQSTYVQRPQATVSRGGTGDNSAILYNDVHAAYQNALRWKITGDAAYGNKARDILNDWSATLTTVTGNADRFLAAGIYGYQFCNAAEIMRGYSGFDIARFKTMMLNVFYPLNNDFLVNHNGACITNYWSNWDLCNMSSVLAIGILCDDQAKIDQAINYFKTGAGNGAITKAIPFLHSGGLNQMQEAGRDQGHCTLSVGLMSAFCEMAWNQGYDLYSYSSSRFQGGAEYVARYNRGLDVPFTTYTWGSGTNCAQMSHTAVSSAGRGNTRPIWVGVVGHYSGRKGLAMVESKAYATALGTEGGGGDYGNGGGFDQLGFGDLCFNRTIGGSALVANGTYSLQNRASGKMLDNLGATTDGAGVGQWADGSSNNQKWTLSYANGYYTLTCVTGGKRLDSLGNYANGTTIGQWSVGGSTNQQWILIPTNSGYYKVVNRATDKCLDTSGATTDGAIMKLWANGNSNNQQWRFVAP